MCCNEGQVLLSFQVSLLLFVCCRLIAFLCKTIHFKVSFWCLWKKCLKRSQKNDEITLYLWNKIFMMSVYCEVKILPRLSNRDKWDNLFFFSILFSSIQYRALHYGRIQRNALKRCNHIGIGVMFFLKWSSLPAFPLCPAECLTLDPSSSSSSSSLSSSTSSSIFIQVFDVCRTRKWWE